MVNAVSPQKVRSLTEGVIPSQQYIEILANLGYSFRLNECNDKIEVNGQPLTDPLRVKIRTQLRDLGYKRLVAIEEAWMAHAFDNRYHPLKDRFQALRWNGEPNIVTLTSHFQDVDNVLGLWLRKWMVGAIAKVMAQGQNAMLVLDGPQGCGKSFFVSWLASPFADYHIESPINPDDKDFLIRLISHFTWEVAELGATTRKADREALKNFISQKMVKVRKAFGRNDTEKPAMASLIGTINNEAGFLNDPTGNRRFLVCQVANIDWHYTALNPEQLWAEAYELYLNGFNWELTPEEQEQQKTVNDRYRTESPVHDLFLSYYRIDPGITAVTPTIDILKYLEGKGLKGSQRANQMELAGILKELGVEKVDKRPRGYKGVIKIGS